MLTCKANTEWIYFNVYTPAQSHAFIHFARKLTKINLIIPSSYYTERSGCTGADVFWANLNSYSKRTVDLYLLGRGCWKYWCPSEYPHSPNTPGQQTGHLNKERHLYLVQHDDNDIITGHRIVLFRYSHILCEVPCCDGSTILDIMALRTGVVTM